MAASFQDCLKLKVAEGTFSGYANFSKSSIAKIGDLAITKACPDGLAALFGGCPNLKAAEGTFPGAVDFTNSGISSIGELTITHSDVDGIAGWFGDCKNLSYVPVAWLDDARFEFDAATRIRIDRVQSARRILKDTPVFEL